MTDGFAQLVEDALRARASRDPAWASFQGLRAHDADVADPTPEAFREELGSLRGFLRRLDHVDAPPVDGTALRVALEVRAFELAETRRWARDPDLAREFLDHLLPLVVCERSPEERAAALEARLRAAPGFLETGRDRFEPAEVPPLWIAAAVETVAAAPAFLRTVRASVNGHAGGALPEAFRVAESALADHGRWLQEEVRPDAAGSWALGEKKLDRLLATYRIREDAAGARDLTERVLASFREQLGDAARSVLAEHGKSLAREDATEAAERVVQSEHPSSFAAALDACRASARAAREFTRGWGFPEVPPEESLQVIETPAYLRHLLPFGGYVAPGRFDDVLRGTWLVTPKVDLAAFSPASVRNAAARVAFPGRHFQAWSAHRTPAARALQAPPDLTDGWALYAEALAGRHGFTAHPEERFVRAKDAVRRAACAVLDAALHVGDMDFEEAVNRLARWTGMTRMEAVAAVRRITLQPGDAICGLVGRVRLEDLRERALATSLDEGAFHARVLRAGNLPVSLLGAEVFRASTTVR